MQQINPSKKLSVKHLWVALAFLVVIGGYAYYELALKYNFNGSTLIDNPTARSINVTIDNKAYSIAANSFLKIDLPEGKHKITCKQYDIIEQELNIDPTQYGVINPTKSKYVIYNIIYTKKDLKKQFKPYEVEGRQVFSLLGAPEVTTDLFIPDRTMGKGNIDDKEPSMESYSEVNQDYAFLTKIFRLNEFFDFYDKNNG